MRISDWSSDVCSSDLLILCASRGGSYNGAVSKGGKGLQARSEGPFMSLTRISVGLAMAVALASCGGGKERPKADIAASRVTTIGVNAYLWRAALDTISFMPLAQADANSGVIIRDWYARSEERRVGKECVSKCRSRWSPDH